MRSALGKTAWISPALSRGKPIHGIVFAQGPWGILWVMQEDLTLGENSLWY